MSAHNVVTLQPGLPLAHSRERCQGTYREIYQRGPPTLPRDGEYVCASKWINSGHGDKPLAHTYPASNGWLLVLVRSHRADAKSAICAL
jgi:hypothetical protein